MTGPGRRRRQHLHHRRDLPEVGEVRRRVRSGVHGSGLVRGRSVHVRVDGLADDRFFSRRAVRHAGGSGLRPVRGRLALHQLPDAGHRLHRSARAQRRQRKVGSLRRRLLLQVGQPGELAPQQRLESCWKYGAMVSWLHGSCVIGHGVMDRFPPCGASSPAVFDSRNIQTFFSSWV